MKYEADGGPGLLDVGRVLAGSIRCAEDLETLFKVQLVSWMLAATDGHAKNFSIRIPLGGPYQSTRWYNMLSAWPIIGKRADHLSYEKAKRAMAVPATRAHYRIRDVQPRHFDLLARWLRLTKSAERISRRSSRHNN